MVTQWKDPYPELKARFEAAKSEGEARALVAEMNNSALTVYQHEALANLARAKIAEFKVSISPRREEAPKPGDLSLGFGETTVRLGVDAQKALDAIEPAVMPPRPQLPAVPKAPGSPQEALANIKRAGLSALRTQLGRGLLNDDGHMVALNPVQEMLALGICTTYGLQPGMGDLMLMGGQPYPTAPAGLVKIVKKNTAFRAWLKTEWPIEDDEKKRFKCRSGARFKDPEHPNDPGYDIFVIEEGYADAGNVTKLIRDPKSAGGSGFIRDMAENRMLRKVQEKSTPIEVDWERVGIVVAGSPNDSGAEKAGIERVAPQDASGATASVKGGLAVSHEPASAVSVSAAVKPEPPGDSSQEPATDLQVQKIRELAKSSNPTVQLLKAAYQKANGDDPGGGDANDRWSMLAASKFIDEATDILKGTRKG